MTTISAAAAKRPKPREGDKPREGGPSPESTRVYRQDSRLYGYISGRVLHKRVRRSVHFLHTPPAIAFQAWVLDTYAGKFDFLQVYDSDCRDTYRVSRADALLYGFDPRRGFEPQVAVPLGRWAKNGVPPYEAPQCPLDAPHTPATATARGAAGTGSLFDL